VKNAVVVHLKGILIVSTGKELFRRDWNRDRDILSDRSWGKDFDKVEIGHMELFP